MRSSEEEFNPIDIPTYFRNLFLGENATKAIPNMGFNLVNVEGELECETHVSDGSMGSGGCETTCGDVGVSLIVLDSVARSLVSSSKRFHSLILVPFDGLDIGLLGDVIDEDDCDDDD
ncbi:hypothetical protein Tco_1219672 [Tanacetum coccineum]